MFGLILAVSIPFKRESISKVSSHLHSRWQFLFQFPSNGKVYPKGEVIMLNPLKSIAVSIPFKRESISKVESITAGNDDDEFIVSIPFKRESISKAKVAISNRPSALMFQFPSNGKVYPKEEQLFLSAVISLFQFPSNGKVYPKGTYPNSIFVADHSFQFPSNGKVYPKCHAQILMRLLSMTVSIPFKRESISKVTAGTTNGVNYLSFNSLQTGKYIQSMVSKFFALMIAFQFPSNGKVYPKVSLRIASVNKAKGFQFPSNGKVYPKHAG